MNNNEYLIISKSDINEIKSMLEQLLSQSSGKSSTTRASEYVTEAEAVKILGVAKSTLHVWKSRGKIAFYKPEGNKKGITYYKMSDLIAFQTGVKHKSNKELEAEADDYMLKNRK